VLTTAADLPAWVDALRWQLLPALRDQGVVRLDTRAALNVEAWLDAALARGVLPGDAAGAQGPLRAILCKSAREQMAFDAAFERWAANPGGVGVPGPKPPAPGSTPEALAQGAERAHRILRRKRLKALAAVLAALAVLALGYLAWKHWSPVPEPGFKPAEPPASTPAATGSAPMLFKLEVQLPAAANAASAASAPDSAPPPSQPELSPRLFGIHPVLYAALVALAALVGLSVRRTRRDYIRRITTRENLREQEVFVRQLLPVSGSRREHLRRTVRLLRRPEAAGAPELDVLASARASATRAGLFTGVWRSRLVTPEVLVLVERLRPGDQQAHWALEAARDLAAEGVRLSLYEFDRDPRWVAPLRWQRSARAPAPQRYLPLATLSASHAGQGLLVLADGAGLIDHREGRLHHWMAAALAPWPRRVLMTPRPMAAWGAAEDVLAGEGQPPHEPSFLLLPQQADAWLAAARWLRLGKLSAIGAMPGAPAAGPPLLAEDPARFLGRVAPPANELVALVEQLRDHLGPAAYTWLAASAAYPLLSADLTAFLAHRLSEPDVAMGTVDAQPAAPDAHLLEARLLAIAQLPWCRHGQMPDWLRRALWLGLPRATRGRVRVVLLNLFEKAGDPELADTAMPMGRVATDAPAGSGSRRWQRWKDRIRLKGVLEKEPIDSPLRDVIYLGVLSGELDQELSLEATEEFARAARAEGDARLSRNPLRWVAAVGLSAWFAVLWLVWRASRVHGRRRNANEPEVVPAPPVEPAASLKVRTSIYISHGRGGAESAEAVHGMLSRHFPGQVFLDGLSISVGEDWKARSDQALKAATVFLVLVDVAEPGFESERQTHELDTATKSGKTIVPVLIDGALLPRSLEMWQAFNLSTKRQEEDLRHLVEVLRQLLAKPPRPAGVKK